MRIPWFFSCVHLFFKIKVGWRRFCTLMKRNICHYFLCENLILFEYILSYIWSVCYLILYIEEWFLTMTRDGTNLAHTLAILTQCCIWKYRNARTFWECGRTAQVKLYMNSPSGCWLVESIRPSGRSRILRLGIQNIKRP